MPADRSGAPSAIVRIVPLVLLVGGLALFLALDLHRHLGFDALARNREAMLAWVERYGALAPVAFGALYALSTAFSLPIGLLLTVVAGFLFGPILGTVVVVAGATLGSSALFLAVRSAICASLRAKAGRRAARMARGFEENAFSYLLVLRLVPLFPFWLVNVVPAFTGVPLRTYVLATALGIVPGTIVYALVGNGLGAVLDAGDAPDLGIILRPEILAPILGLALLALVPVAYKRFHRARRE